MKLKRIDYDKGVFQAMWTGDYTVAEMATFFGFSPSLVSKNAKRLGLKPRNTNGLSLPTEAILAAYAKGYSLDDIRDWLRPRFARISSETVGDALKRKGVKVTRRRPRKNRRHKRLPLGRL